jgi:hypothetical protein
MFNQISNFFHLLLKGGGYTDTPDPESVVVIGVQDPRKGFASRYKPVMTKIKNLGGGGLNGPICDITMEQKGITFGPEVAFSIDFNLQIPTPDILIPGQLELLCDPFSNTWFNVVDMSQPDWNTQYTGGPWGFGDLSDIETRTYAPWTIVSSCFKHILGNLFHIV